ncbi:MAG: ABC transporter ATP-binding protein [Acidithiobacillus sp.]|uniref:ABC transporter ATP-binding protein n=1 Tax=Acidithiobacillus sp. TaxID=1872118 RepID=UPI003D02C352
MTAAATVSSKPIADNAPLRCLGLSKRFGTQEVLKDISFTLDSGEFAVLIGPNGAGKSTLLSILVGLILPDRGSVFVLDGEIARLKEAQRLEIGYVPQDFSGFGWMPVGELLDYIGAFYPRERRCWPELEDWAALSRRTRVQELSGGQRQRLAVVLALRHRPRLALLDEPVSSLDPRARLDFVRLLHSDCQARGSTCLLSSHILSDLEPLADRSLILHRGCLLGDWSTVDRREDLRWLYPQADGLGLPTLPAGLEVLTKTADGTILVRGWRALSATERAQSEALWRSEIPQDMGSIFLALTDAERS